MMMDEEKLEKFEQDMKVYVDSCIDRHIRRPNRPVSQDQAGHAFAGCQQMAAFLAKYYGLNESGE